MDFRNISDNRKTTYRLAAGEKVSFLMENRAGETVFELSGAGAEAHILVLLTGTGNEAFEPRIVVRHLAPDTLSRTDVRAVLDGSASLRVRGRVEITRDAVRSDAREDVRALLLSENARASAIPELEIETDLVSCSHAATIAPADAEQIRYLGTRGIPKAVATRLLADGFLREPRETLRKTGS